MQLCLEAICKHVKVKNLGFSRMRSRKRLLTPKNCSRGVIWQHFAFLHLSLAGLLLEFIKTRVRCNTRYGPADNSSWPYWRVAGLSTLLLDHQDSTSARFPHPTAQGCLSASSPAPFAVPAPRLGVFCRV